MITKRGRQRNLKRDYIEATYDILCEVGMEGFTIRKVADRVGCSSAALYKHFSDAEHLISLASVRYLRNYSADTAFLSQMESDYLEMNLLLWESFAYYSFENIPIFENLFFGKNTKKIQEIVLEYYAEFPDDLAKLSGYFLMIMQSSNLLERDFIMLKRAADEGRITLKSADFLSKTDVYIYRGMLMMYRDSYKEPGVARKATREFIDLLRENYRMHLI
ncbi:MAG: TetR/AcrR family transcriptional regulator [Bacillota bacterium]|nr:TetR/AcrR family transcriptional regulator [Bacillota bacterium]